MKIIFTPTFPFLWFIYPHQKLEQTKSWPDEFMETENVERNKMRAKDTWRTSVTLRLLLASLVRTFVSYLDLEY